MTYVAIPKALQVTADINSYSDSGDARKRAMHTQGKKFLKQLAETLGESIGNFTIRSNMAGIAVSGEVTLHADFLYVQLSEHCCGERGVSMLYRSCKSQKDYNGGHNNTTTMRQFAEEDAQYRIMETMKRLAESERSKQLTPA